MIDELAPNLLTLAGTGVAGLWVVYFIYKEKAFFQMMKESNDHIKSAIENNTEAIRQLQRWVEYASKQN